MNAKVQADGNLRIEADAEDRDYLREMEGYYDDREAHVLQIFQDEYRACPAGRSRRVDGSPHPCPV